MTARTAGLLCLFLSPLWAQEPAFMEAATHPARGNLYSRAFWADGVTSLKNAYGLSADLALLPDVMLDGQGALGADLRLKQRLWRHDTGPVDTWRISATAGISWREGRDPGPRAGIASTTIRGRHGVNAQFDINAAAPGAERMELNASYLYRLLPARFAPETKGAWYSMVESLNGLSPDADTQSDLAVGLLYEARRWAAEISLRFGDTDTHLGAGVRLLW